MYSKKEIEEGLQKLGYKLKHSINCLLPKDIYIKDIKEVNDDFHARFNVKAKEYVYKINMGEYKVKLFIYILVELPVI